MKTTKIAISLPADLLDVVERERKATGKTRSEMFRLAMETFLREKQERERAERYVRGYREHPETDEDLALAEYSMRVAFQDNPWESETGQ